MFLPAFLNEVFGMPLAKTQILQRQLAYEFHQAQSNLSKETLYQKLSRIVCKRRL